MSEMNATEEYSLFRLTHKDILQTRGISILIMVTSTLGITANALIGLIILKFKELQTTRNILIFNWSLWDFLYIAFVHISRLTQRKGFTRMFVTLQYTQKLMKISLMSNIIMLSLNLIFNHLNTRTLSYILYLTWTSFTVLFCYYCLTEDIPDILIVDYIDLAMFLILLIFAFIKLIGIVIKLIIPSKINVENIVLFSYVSCWFLAQLFQVFGIVFQDSKPIFVVASKMFETLGYPHSVLLLMQLVYFDFDMLNCFVKFVTFNFYNVVVNPAYKKKKNKKAAKIKKEQ